MSFEDTVRDYLVSMHDYVETTAATGETTAELSYRPVLDAFIRRLSQLYCPDVDVIFEPKDQGHAGRPDWRIYNRVDFGLYGFVEAKGLDPANPINIEPHKVQIRKYLSTGQRVILTDGLEFIFFEPGAIDKPHRHSLVAKPIQRHVCRESTIDFLMDNRLRDFFHESGSRQCSEEQLIHEMAVRAFALAQCVLVLSQAPLGSGFSSEENQTIEILHDLQSTLALHHDPVLVEPKVFADFVAQVLCFGLMYAHRVVAGGSDESPPDKYDAIGKFWSDAVYAGHSDRLVPFKALVQVLESELSANQDSTSQLRCWYDDARRLLAHVQLRDRQRDTPDYHTLYERFLAEFDPQTRFDFGAFYTPAELAGFSVGLSRAVIESTFAGRTLFETGNTIIDPCCGTGTFLEQLVRQSVDCDSAHLVGFEILPAPYALAHYRMAMLQEEDVPSHDIDVFLTNTLSDTLAADQAIHEGNVLDEELSKARDCASAPIVLVIGNPPSSDSFGPHSTGNNFSAINALLNSFRPPQAERRGRQNTQKQIGNDFMKFLRWASDKTLASENSVLALILPSTFAEHPTYRYARKWLVENFGYFWVLDIDRDLRTGVPSASLFSARQGRMLLIATNSGATPSSLECRLNYVSIRDRSKAQKLDFLSSGRTTANFLAEFTTYSINEESFGFRPRVPTYDQDLYSRFWAIHSADPREPALGERFIFARHCSGTKLAPTSMFVHKSRPVLQRRSREIGDTNTRYEDLKERWFAGQMRPPTESKFTAEVRNCIRVAAEDESAYRVYSFRPFLPMQLLFDSALLRTLGDLGGRGTRVRPEVVAAFDRPATVGITIAPSPVDLGDELHRFATFCWHMPDNDLCSRGNAHVFCDRFPDLKPTGRCQEWDSTPKENISDTLLELMCDVRPETSAQDVVFYTYAALCSGVLLEAFADAYFTASAAENIARIPIVNDPLVMDQLICKGRAIAELEHPDADAQDPPWVGELDGRFEEPFRLTKFQIDSDRSEILLYGELEEPIIILDGIPEQILELKISGYEVVACWLKFHSYKYTRIDFSEDDYSSLLRLLGRLENQFSIIEEIDTVMAQILAGNVGLIH